MTKTTIPAAVWATRDGRRIPLTDLDDHHVKSILNMGLRAISRKRTLQALDDLAQACGADEGAEYLADVQFEEAALKARDPKGLRSALRKSPRFGPVWHEGHRRGILHFRGAAYV
jgi:hypothetical protein